MNTTSREDDSHDPLKNQNIIDLSHLPSGPAPKTEFPKDTGVPHWNYERCTAVVGSVIMGDTSEFPCHWGKKLEGIRVPAIRIEYENRIFYIHNEPDGFYKVFCAGGGPFSGSHQSLCVDDEDSFILDEDQPAPKLISTKKLSQVSSNPQKGGTTRIGRNELCPCGSGKKYKKCCIG